jgi:hypothetical protein
MSCIASYYLGVNSCLYPLGRIRRDWIWALTGIIQTREKKIAVVDTEKRPVKEKVRISIQTKETEYEK